MYSRRWFRYTTDSNQIFAILADESNTELLNAPVVTQAGVAGLTRLPQGITPRSVTVARNDGLIQRKIYILTQGAYAALNNAVDYQLSSYSGVDSAEVVSIRRKNSEKVLRQPFTGDTGLVDGDIP